MQGDDSDDDWEYTPKGITDEEFNDNLNYLSNHPLFLKELPQDFEKNEDVTALQNLIYNEEPIKIARHLNDKGKEILGRGQHKYYVREALKSYEEALGQEFEDDELKARIHSNKAFVHYKLKNYGKAIEDSFEAIKKNPSFIKPYFRCGQAYLTLERYQDCIDILDKGLLVDPDCKEIIALKKDAEAKLAAYKAKLAKKDQDVNHKFVKLVEDFRARGYVLGRTRVHNIPEAYQREPFVDTDGVLKFPIVITYLEFGQIDFIQQATETDILSDHLREIFKDRLPWDEKGHYDYKNLAIFVELNCIAPMFKSPNHSNYEKGFLRIGRKKQLSEILKINGYVMPFILEIHVLSKASPFFDKFMKDFDIVRNE